MTKEQELYHAIAASIPDTKQTKMFGALCIKAPNGKMGVMFWKEHMVFKLDAATQAELLTLEGTKMFTPMDGRAMNGWIQVPAQHSAKWQHYAELAMEYVRKIEGKKKAKQ